MHFRSQMKGGGGEGIHAIIRQRSLLIEKQFMHVRIELVLSLRVTKSRRLRI